MAQAYHFFRDERALLRGQFDGEELVKGFETLTESGWKPNGVPRFDALELDEEQAREFSVELFGHPQDLYAEPVG